MKNKHVKIMKAYTTLCLKKRPNFTFFKQLRQKPSDLYDFW